MAIPAFDATSETSSSSASSLTYAHTVASDGSLIVSSNGRDNFTGTQTITYDGDSLTEYTGSGDTSRLFYIASPTTGSSNNIVVTLTGTGACASIAISVTGADTSDLVGATQTASGSGTNPTESITTDTDNSLVIDTVTNDADGGSMAPGSGQTQRGTDISQASNFTCACSEEGVATAGATTMDWTTGDNSWSVAAIEIHGAASTATDSSLSLSNF